MKHYFSFLVLSLFVFLSLVCPSPVMASTALDFTWTTVDSEYPSNGSFSFSGKENDAIKSWGDSWVGFNSNVTATSRSTYSLTEGTYVFTLRVQWKNENRTNTQVPKIVINNGSDYEFTHPNVDLSNGVAVDLRYFVTVPSTGSYTIKVVSVDGERDKFGIRSLTIPSDPISCVYTINGLTMKVITIDNVSTFELSHSTNAITYINNVNLSSSNGGTTSDLNTSGWTIKDGKATKDVTWGTLPTDNTITTVHFYCTAGTGVGGDFNNVDISCSDSNSGSGGSSSTWCDKATGHLGDASFGDVNGRILLNVRKISNTSVGVTVKPNNGNDVALDYVKVQIGANYQELGAIGGSTPTNTEIVFTDLASLSFTVQVWWHHSTWGDAAGRWTTNGISITESDLCDESVCSAPNHVDVTGTWHIFNGDDIELTARAYSTEGTSDEITEGLTYQWYKNGTEEGNKIAGATSATYTKSSCTYSDAGAYYCKISTSEGCETCSGYYDVKMLRVYVKNSKGGSDYGYIDLIDLGNYEAQGTIRLATGGKTYGFGVADGCTGYYGNTGTMTSSNCTDWSMDNGYDCQLTSTSVATYTFTVKYGSMYNTGTYGNYIKVSVTYPSNNQTSGKIIYFDNSLVNWSNVHYRIGKSNNVNYLVGGMIDVPGTASLKKMTTWAYSGFEAWHICDNTGWTGDNNTIYRTYTNNDKYQISNSIEFDGGAITDAAVTIVPRGNESSDHYTGGESGVNDNCQFYYYELKKYLWTHTATITTPTNGTIQIAYNDEEHTDEANKVTQTTTTSGLAHTTKLYISTTPATGYEQATLTVNGSNFDASYHVLSANATIAATFSPKSCTVTFDKEGGSDGSNNVTATYDAAMPDITAPTKTGYTFGGYWDGDNGTGTQYYNADGTSARTWDKNTTSETPLYAKWTAKTTTVSFDQNSGSGGQTSSLTATYGSAMPTPITAPTRTGYDFDGYYDGAGGAGTKYYNNDGTSAKNWDKENATWTLSAKWTAKDYTVTYSNPGNSNSYSISVDGGSAGSENKTAHYGNTITLVASAYTGYAFSSWTIKKTSDNSDVTAYVSLSGQTSTASFTMPDYGVTVTANFAEATCMSTKTIEAESYIPDWFAYKSGAGISKPTDGEFSGTSYVQFNQETEINYFITLPAANYRFHIYHGGAGNNKYFNLYGLDDSAGSDYVTYNGHKYKNTQYKGTALNLGGSRWTEQVVACDLPANDYIIGLYGNDGSNIIYDKIVIEANGNVDNNVFCYHSITMNTTVGADGEATSGVGRALLGDIVTISAPAASSGYHFTGWTASSSVTFTSDPSVASNSFTMPDEDVTLTANYALDELTISSLPWAGSQDLTGQTVVSAEAISSCFDTEITFTFSRSGTVNYYDNNARKTPLGTITSGTAITLTDDLRTHGIYIKCTSGSATLTEVSKTTIGSVYQIWSGNVAVENWSQQVVLGPEHFQTAEVGDVLRVNTSGEGGDAQGALQYIYTEGDSHTYKGLDNSTSNGLHNWDLTSEEKSQHYFEITINATHLANLKRYGVIVKGRYYTIQSVELRASCSNRSMRTTAPDVTRYADVNIMTTNIDFGEGFTLGNWENKLELDESCFTSVTVGSVINLYMSVDGDATLSFRCNVDSVHAKSYGEPPLCPSYGDISFDRTIDDLYGDAPAVVGATEGYKVLYLLVDADMRRRLQETGMILCGKGTLIKVVEGVPDTVVVNPGVKRHVPTVVNNLKIYQGGEVTNTEDIEVLGKITYIRPAQDDGTDDQLGNNLDQWYTFALPFTVSDVEVLDTDGKWYDINAVYYSNDTTDQATNDPDGAGHYYLQYLKAENETAIGRAFAARWQYITPGHSLACVSEWDGTRYGYPKKDEAYIILFDSDQPIGDYFQTNTQIRFVGVGPQTIDGVAKEWKVEADGEQYWMYANNTLHSFTLSDAYILNDAGTEFVLQESPTIRPFECYVQATKSLKDKYAAIPMRGFRIDNTTTGAESIQGSAIRAEKILRNGQLIIIRNGVEYDATGVVIR